MFEGSKRNKQPPVAGEESKAALAMVLLEAPQPLTPDGLIRAWTETWPQHPVPADIQGGNENGGVDAMTLTIDGLTAALAVMPVTIPGGELEGPAVTSWLWPDASESVARVGAHVVAWVQGGSRAVDNRVALTRLVAAVIKATDALGVYWGSAGQVIRADVFGAMAQAYDGEGLPVMLWIDFRGFFDGRHASLFTQGLDDFGLMEIEVHQSTKPVGELRDFVMNIATYLIEEAPVINDGDTIGGSEDERILVRHRLSAFNRPGTVYSLEGL